uniref:CSON009196 protein n=1 Tax=Culicoides sonorensis TaxID=179676 RepID=A0A336LZJ8_CULSO
MRVYVIRVLFFVVSFSIGTNAGEWDFLCEGIEAYTQIPNPYDCKKYFQCMENGEAIPGNCPPGLAFDINLAICFPENLVDCSHISSTILSTEGTTTIESSSETSSSDLSTTEPTGPGGEWDYLCKDVTPNTVVHHPYDCQKFFQCGNNGEAIPGQCQAGQAFDKDIGFCLPESMVDCSHIMSSTVGSSTSPETTTAVSTSEESSTVTEESTTEATTTVTSTESSTIETTPETTTTETPTETTTEEITTVSSTESSTLETTTETIPETTMTPEPTTESTTTELSSSSSSVSETSSTTTEEITTTSEEISSSTTTTTPEEISSSTTTNALTSTITYPTGFPISPGPEIPEPGVQCPPLSDTENKPVFLASKINCSKYYLCYLGLPVALECQENTHFNRFENNCDDPFYAHCQAANWTDPNPFPECPRRGRVNLPRVNNCEYFVSCNEGVGSLQKCPFYHGWDLRTQSCQLRNVALCA